MANTLQAPTWVVRDVARHFVGSLRATESTARAKRAWEDWYSYRADDILDQTVDIRVPPPTPRACPYCGGHPGTGRTCEGCGASAHNG